MKRRNFFKALFTLLNIAIWGIIYSAPVYAQLQLQNPVQFNSLEEIINRGSGILRIVTVIAFVLVIMYGGWIRFSAGDNADQIKRSSLIIVSGAVGFAIIVLAPALVEFFGGLIGVEGNLLDLNPSSS